MIKDLKSYGVRPKFFTQTTLWRGDLIPEEMDLLWKGLAAVLSYFVSRLLLTVVFYLVPARLL